MADETEIFFKQTKAENMERDSGRLDIALVSLHKHWITADAVKERLRLDVKGEQNELPEDFAAAGQLMSMAQVLSVFYGLIYVVVEGYRSLAKKDEAIEKLLAHKDYVDRLRKFRNAVFHFQKDPIDKRLLEFLEAEDSETWIKELYAALERFLMNELPIEETYRKLHEEGGLPEGFGKKAV